MFEMYSILVRKTAELFGPEPHGDGGFGVSGSEWSEEGVGSKEEGLVVGPGWFGGS